MKRSSLFFHYTFEGLSGWERLIHRSAEIQSSCRPGKPYKDPLHVQNRRLQGMRLGLTSTAFILLPKSRASQGDIHMAYDLHRIFLQVRRNLELTPSMSLAQLSKNLAIERHTVEKAVKKATGVSFREFRNDVLLRRAQDLLKDESNRTVKEVAFALGYRSQGSLSRFIRIMTGNSAKTIQIGKPEEKAS